MSELDDTDLEILRLLIEDSRRPYSDVAERVDLSPPTVSDRIDRLVELGVIEQFTVDVNREVLAGGVSVLVELHARPGRTETLQGEIETLPPVEHVFATVDDRVVFTATLDQGDVRSTVLELLDSDNVQDYDVRMLADESWNPRPPNVALALRCDECENTVTSEGESMRLDGRRYHFCCPSCLSRFEERYERLSQSGE